MGLLAPMIAVFGVQDKSEQEWATFWNVYAEALGDLPADAIRQGVRDFLALPTAEWFPKPGPLRVLCVARAETMAGTVDRIAARDIEINNQPWAAPTADELAAMTPEDQARTRRIIASHARPKFTPPTAA